MSAARFWIELEAAEARRRELSKVTHEMRAKKQVRVASNDEPEPIVLTEEDRKLAEGFAGEQPFEVAK